MRFSGRRESSYPARPKKEVQVDELKKVLEEALKDKPGEQT
jgi:hypothetical protein